MGFVKEIPQLTEALDCKLQALEPKLQQFKQQYDTLADENKELWDQRYPEKQQKYVKETLYQAYLHSQRSLKRVLIYMAKPDVKDRYAYHDEGMGYLSHKTVGSSHICYGRSQ